MFDFGFAQEDITPVRGVPLCGYFNPRPNRGILDPLAVRASVFRTANGEYSGIVNFDLCFLDYKLTKEFISALAKEGISWGNRILFCATHTHTGPYTTCLFGFDADAEYLKSLVAKTVTAIKEAAANLAPAELFATTTECNHLGYNRRFFMKDGSVLTNPGKLNPNIDRPEGGMDPQIPMLAVKQDGFYRALFVNIVNHTDTIGGDFVSADWTGRMEHAIQTSVGYDIPVFTLIGCQGNINHFNITTPVEQTSYEEATRIGKAYASVIVSAMYQLVKVDFEKIVIASEELEVPYCTVTDEEYAEAKRVIEENKNATMEAGRDFTSEDIARKHPYVLKYFAERLADCREKPIKGKRLEMMMSMKFGDVIGMVTYPCEPFVELGLEVKKVSSFPYTFVVGLAFGECGYVGLPEHYQHGNAAYETSPDPTRVAADVGARMLEQAKRMIRG